MNPRTTALLALIALALGLWVYQVEIAGEADRQAALDEQQKVFSGLSADDVDAVTLTTLDGVPARFERREGRWEVVTPVLARADQAALDAIVSALVDLPREGTVDAPDAPDATRLAGFGLGDEARVVRFEVAGETKGLRIGRATPVGGHRYVARLADDEVAYVTSFRINAFNRNLDDLRERRLFGFEAGDVRTLRLRWPTAPSTGRDGEQDFVEVALARDDAGEWQLGVPLVARADDQIVRDLLSDLAYLRAEGFLDAPDEAARKALAETAIEFHWTLEGDHLERSARIAGELDGDRVVAVGADERRLFTVPAERLDDFPRRVADYRFKRLSSFEVSQARQLVLELRGEAVPPADAGVDEDELEVRAELVEAGWTSEPPRIDPDRAGDLVRTLSNVRAVDIVADAMGPRERASLGLNPPRARLRVASAPPAEANAEAKSGAHSEDRDDASRRLLADLAIGRLDPDRGLFAQRAGDETVYLLPVSMSGSLPVSIEGFRADFAAEAGTEGADSAESVPALEASEPEADPLEDLELP